MSLNNQEFLGKTSSHFSFLNQIETTNISRQIIILSIAPEKGKLKSQKQVL